jgi:hypothetical protein
MRCVRSSIQKRDVLWMEQGFLVIVGLLSEDTSQVSNELNENNTKALIKEGSAS